MPRTTAEAENNTILFKTEDIKIEVFNVGATAIATAKHLKLNDRRETYLFTGTVIVCYCK